MSFVLRTSLNPTTPAPISLVYVSSALASIDWSVVCNMLSSIGTVAAVFVAIYIYLVDKRPDVVCYLDVDSDQGFLSFNVTNYGNSGARNIQIGGFDYSFCQSELKNKVMQTFVSRSIPCLVPNTSRKTIICITNWAVDNLADKRCVAAVSHERNGLFGGLGKEKESFILDYYSFANSLYAKSERHLSRVALEKIARKLGA